MDSQFKQLAIQDIEEAQKRIKNYVNHTPLIHSDYINSKLNNRIYFKIESLQKTGAFKIRGVYNKLLALKEQNQLPKKVATFSSGNHGKGLVYACKSLGINDIAVYMTHNSSAIKQKAIKSMGGDVILKESRDKIYLQIQKDVADGATYIPTSDDDYIITGQGTSSLEALKEKPEIDIMFAPCGGGGLLSGTYLASGYNNKTRKVIGVEPELANDAQKSFKTGSIFKFDREIKETIADGARTPSLTERTFNYIKHINDMIDVSERDIMYWTQQLADILKFTIEPTSAMTVAGCYKWLKLNPNFQDKDILIIISGGNISNEAHQKIWKENLLEEDFGLWYLKK